MSKLVQILSLAGKPVAGLLADLRSRTADGELMHDSQAHDAHVSRLKRVYIKRQGGRKWLIWEWQLDRKRLSDCGYSGIAMDCKEVGDYYLLLLEEPQCKGRNT